MTVHYWPDPLTPDVIAVLAIVLLVALVIAAPLGA